MKTLSFARTGNAEDVLEITEKPVPVPGDDQVLIKILASPVNPADLMFIEGRSPYQRMFPQTAGMEGAGIVQSTGKNVRGLEGRLAAFDAWGAWAEYIVVRRESIIILPDGFPIYKAAQFFLNPLTAWGLLESSGLSAGNWLLLTAAGSAVSRIVVQLAKLQGMRVIAAVRDMCNAEELRLLGADAVLNARDVSFLGKVCELTAGRGVDAVLDAVGGEIGTNVIQTLAENGRQLIYGLLSPEPMRIFNADIIFKQLAITGFDVRRFLPAQTQMQKDEMIKTLIEEISKESFRLPATGCFALEDFKAALTANEQSGRTGKVIFNNQ
jgi:NADPH2:quinone reductase